MKWRWDQGRLDYFQFDEITRLARALAAFDGQSLPRGEDADALRVILETYSDRPFAPENYKVWRNYKRVFGCQLLAADIGRLLVATDLCKNVASGSVDADGYLIHVAKHFYYPSPVFEGYQVTGPQLFPMCGILKYLISQFLTRDKLFISLDQIIDVVKGNSITGQESLSVYNSLRETGTRINPSDDEYRQIREMVRFMSQLSFLKWENPYLYLDVLTKDQAMQIVDLLDPVVMPRETDPSREIIRLGGFTVTAALPEFEQAKDSNPFDLEFTEGARVRRVHLRVERSSRLKEIYFNQTPNPHHCDVCMMDTRKHYPWSDRLIELHHLLPLSSPIRVESNSTSLRDIVGLCPSCHRATHKLYSKWLKEEGLKDFRDYSEAKLAYQAVKDSYVE